MIESSGQHGQPPPPRSPRGELARVALAVALDHAAVTRASAGPGARFRTEVSGEPLTGVTVNAEPRGEYCVSLCLETVLTPLPALATELRHRIRNAASAAPGSATPGAIEIRFDDITAAPKETAR